MSVNELEEVARKLIVDSGGQRDKGVDLNKVLSFLKIDKEESDDLKGELSGILTIMKSGRTVIGVSSDESPERKRFTIAHEIGHYILHAHSKKLFLDADITFNRGPVSNIEEVQANAFAAALLMPSNNLKKIVNHEYPSGLNENNIRSLAKDFHVSTIAMTFRLTNLGLI